MSDTPNNSEQARLDRCRKLLGQFRRAFYFNYTLPPNTRSDMLIVTATVIDLLSTELGLEGLPIGIELANAKGIWPTFEAVESPRTP